MRSLFWTAILALSAGGLLLAVRSPVQARDYRGCAATHSGYYPGHYARYCGPGVAETRTYYYTPGSGSAEPSSSETRAYYYAPNSSGPRPAGSYYPRSYRGPSSDAEGQHFYDPDGGRAPAGPPGSNDPYSLGVGQG
jgi:hypothetical protein